MSTEIAALLVAVGAFVVAGLVHFASIARDRAAEGRAVHRAREQRIADARERAISDVVQAYKQLRVATGAGNSLVTVRDAGILTLTTDADMREAIDRMATFLQQDPFEGARELLRDVDLVEYFTACRDHSLNPQSPGQVLERMNALSAT